MSLIMGIAPDAVQDARVTQSGLRNDPREKGSLKAGAGYHWPVPDPLAGTITLPIAIEATPPPLRCSAIWRKNPWFASPGTSARSFN